MPGAEFRAARANRVFRADEKRIRTENTVMVKSNNDLVLFLSKITDCVRTDFRPRAIGDPRGRDAVRASSSATVRDFCQGSPKPVKDHCALSRANRVFGTDKKRIRTKNAVMDKNKDSAGVLYEIADWARMCFSSVPNR